MNINEISEMYLEEKEQRRRASTVDGYRSSISLYILPEFGTQEIETIEPETIQSWVDGFKKPGAAKKPLSAYVRFSIGQYENLGCEFGTRHKELNYQKSRSTALKLSRQTRLLNAYAVSLVIRTNKL